MPLLLDARSITKSYAGVHALNGASFELRAGEVHALVGENGAGKSTLIRILTGAETADSGTLTIAGQPVSHLDPASARRLKIAAIYQHPSLFPDLTVAENIALTLERGGLWRRVDWRERSARARRVLDEAGASIDPDRLAGSLGMAEQQIVEIAKAIGADARIVIMDEPTASLTDHEMERLFAIIDRLRRQNAGVIYISHRLEEVLRIADRVTVLRDGRVVDTCERTETDAARLVRMMVGRELTSFFPKRETTPGEVALRVDHVSSEDAGLRDVTLDVRAGEIVGIAGLVGSGRTELAEALFGLRPYTGAVEVRGAPVRLDTPVDAIRHRIAYLPEDRLRHGVIAEMAIAANVTLARLNAASGAALVDTVADREVARRYIERLRIKAPSPTTSVEQLSGGNQQKVALARWLDTRPAILIVDEPTQGVDVAAKAEIHALLQDLAAEGLAIVMISSDLPEVLGMSDRIAVMRAGTIAAVLSRSDATPDRVLGLAFGHVDARPH